MLTLWKTGFDFDINNIIKGKQKIEKSQVSTKKY